MKKLSLLIALLLLLCASFSKQTQAIDGTGVIYCYQAKSDFALTADPNSAAWKNIPGVSTDKGRRGETVPNQDEPA